MDICCRSGTGGHVIGRQRVSHRMEERLRQIAPLLVVLLAASGCGGSGGSSATSTGSGTVRPVGLVEYLAQIEPKDRQLNKLRAAVLNAVEGVNEGRPDATWARAEKRLAVVTAGLDRLSVSIVHVRAPAPLKSAHQNLAESVAVLEGYVYDVQNALGAKIPALLATAANEDSTRMAVLRGTWEAAVAQYARRLGVTLPAWLGGPALAA